MVMLSSSLLSGWLCQLSRIPHPRVTASPLQCRVLCEGHGVGSVIQFLAGMYVCVSLCASTARAHDARVCVDRAPYLNCCCFCRSSLCSLACAVVQTADDWARGLYETFFRMDQHLISEVACASPLARSTDFVPSLPSSLPPSFPPSRFSPH